MLLNVPFNIQFCKAQPIFHSFAGRGNPIVVSILQICATIHGVKAEAEINVIILGKNFVSNHQ